MSKLTGIELKRAQLVPSAMFASPTAVVQSEALSLPQKIAILRRWEFDVRQGARVTMPALAISHDVRLLKEVRGALAALGAAGLPGAKSVATSRHGGRYGPANLAGLSED